MNPSFPKCCGKKGRCAKRATRGAYCTPCWQARHDMVFIDPDVEYGECHECGVVEGQQCSTQDLNGNSVELALFVHARREGNE